MRRALVVATLAVVLAGCAWARPRFDAANTGNNVLETKISAANVAQLTQQFVAASTTPATIPKFVVARGHLYVSGSPIRAFDATGVAGCSGASPRICSQQWSLDAFGDPDVIGKTLYSGGNAYDADGAVNCAGVPKICTQVWQEGIGSAPFGPTNPNALHFTGRRNIFPHGGESMSLDAYDAPCAPTPADCPVRWSTGSGGLGGGAAGGVFDGPAVGGSRVFAAYSPVAFNATIQAFDGTSGTAPRLWSATLDGVGGGGIAVSDGVVVIALQMPSGTKLEAFDAAGTVNCSGAPKTCQPLWVSDLWTGAGFEAPPAIANGRVYRAVGSQLRAYDLHGSTNCSGSPKVCNKLWVAQVGTGIRAPAVANGLVYVSAADGTVQAYDANGVTNCSATTRVCTSLWDTNAGGSAGPVEVADGRVYVGTADGNVHAYGLSP
ncbi:MAG: outer membrane protein assembly factor BamB family protein [Acidimicrobiia bacterium]